MLPISGARPVGTDRAVSLHSFTSGSFLFISLFMSLLFLFIILSTRLRRFPFSGQLIKKKRALSGEVEIGDCK